MRPVSALIIAGLLVAGPSLFGQDPEPPSEPPPGFPELESLLEENEPEPAAPATDASTAEYKRGVELQRKGKWLAAQKVLRKVLDQWPESVHKREIESRSDDNAFLACDVIHQGGPPARRIDVAVMGDGFTIDSADQMLQEKWARLCLDVLWSEDSFEEYRDYFNYYFVRLASLEEGVDPNLSEEEKAKIIQRNKTRTRKKKIDFSTALDCKAAGPQGQVMADRRLVYKWMKTADRDTPGCNDDGLAIAFARFGVLGMGGGGIANVGRPDKSVTVHEFGHAFVGLLDEYAVNPFPPFGRIEAPNASTTDDPDRVPWAHFLKKKDKYPSVGVFEGGATFRKGVWRPAQGCAMNSAGHTGFCPVCREAAVLRIYAYVNPIDGFAPASTQTVSAAEGGTEMLSVIPMQPRKRSLSVTWYVDAVPGTEPDPEEQPAGGRETGESPPERFRRMREGLFGRYDGGERRTAERSGFGHPPAGIPSTLGTSKKGDRKRPTEHSFPLGRLKAGRYQITAAVKDTTPWVLKDEKHLLEERVSWRVAVGPRK